MTFAHILDLERNDVDYEGRKSDLNTVDSDAQDCKANSHEKEEYATFEFELITCNINQGNEGFDSGSKKRAKSSKRKKTFPCPICSEVFSKKKELTGHLSVHPDFKPVACKTCNKTFSHVCIFVWFI